MTHHGMKPLTGIERYCYHSTKNSREDRFGRMFGDLPPAYTNPQALAALGKAKGPMDGGKKANRTNTVPVGHVFFGQFIDHDITLDVFSKLDAVNTPNAIGNSRSPTLDLDCVFGAGHEPARFMYHGDGPFKDVKLLTGIDQDAGSVETRNDLMRGVNKRAIIGDFRNDENRIVSQLQLGMINFYNRFCDIIHSEEPTLSEGDLRVKAERLTRWHYQWAVVNDFLRAMCGGAVVDHILGAGRKYYCGGVPYIPVEFSVAAYRFGHSMAPQKIQIQKGKSALELFGAGLGRGFTPVPSQDAIVDWHEVFNTDAGRSVQMAEQLDTKMASDLLDLPFIPAGDEASLATRNLLRGNSFLLPGGDIIAAHMDRPQSEIEKVVGVATEASKGAITKGVPLWYYILAEAEKVGRETEKDHFEPGEGLGPVGARIVAETIIGLLEYDESSFLGANRNWSPRPEFDTIGKILASVNSSDL